MEKIALATQIPGDLKKELDAVCEQKGISISHFTTEALREKIEELREEEALLRMAMERMSEPGEQSYADYRRYLKKLK
ncbi:MAG: hypothetical protein A3F82_08200 [Deltaproteobacteria bacterium RIFCSPLOWO2_12_FULL_44_12]|nr:MAG: hypothetical protein A2712_07070 [Deltaproteobacteria bacterium RIFCSPHIGHO2_01_FULL_43_49]OGQ15707.1 MAG: hypothetical protein A3D22_05860 [Deltaproteobacteria bacterium RIFCSPHIGHO2_02_FULL_44_53]OGQ28676.1 MAG: hypothetical protein A3D98_00595 [Deltaproteobacteria bacterium RIFCSPHIGHO2_12_FULL_44_21]OGQ31999.1 MAG: hypothetical protein A2979_02805 [Deltaproteobacteria bacterium RIFCSPLOWO2_01_FULL_45_74]OGQ43612.1 MAG: hypothetical protein A3I70_03320 [Deltaproteobacteria bacterium 